MDYEMIAVAHELLSKIGRPLRWPTIKWLYSDFFNIVDAKATELVKIMEITGRVKITSGGWIEVQYIQ